MLTKQQISETVAKITGDPQLGAKILTGSAKALLVHHNRYSDDYSAAHKLHKRETDEQHRPILATNAARALVLMRLFYAAYFIKDNALGLLHPAVEAETLVALDNYHAALYSFHAHQLAEYADN